ncbi:MAG: cytochrome P460 family protein [Ruegeria sp.]
MNAQTKLSWAGLTVAGLAVGTTMALSQESQQDAHIAIANPAELSKDEARNHYRALRKQMDRGYATAHLDQLINYQNWPLFNDAPYISATHGQRYVNSYANRMAHNYGTLGSDEKLPVGSVLAKDSMTVTDEGNVHPGALFVMEKLPDGSSPETADWRYIMVMPDGSLFGDTKGDRPGAVVYCHDCHEAVAERDYTFFVPEEYRVGN